MKTQKWAYKKIIFRLENEHSEVKILQLRQRTESKNTDLQSVIAFGGEEDVPPKNGKVVIAVKPFNEKFTTQSRKQSLKESISDRTPLAVDPLIVDGSYTYLIPVITTYYDVTKSSLSKAAVASNIRDEIKTFSSANLERFGNKFRFSRFVRALDNTSGGYVMNNDAKIQLQKRITPNTDKAESINIYFNKNLIIWRN